MNLLYALEKLRTPFLEGLMQLFTRFGEELIVIVVFCTLYWCVSKRLAYIIGLGYFMSGISVQTLKIIFRIDRPWIIDPSFKPVESAVEAATGYSFPSGHTNGATALYGALGVNAKRWSFRILWFLPAAVVGFSRMFLGVHTPLDVCTAFILTTAFCIGAKLLFDRFENKPGFELTVAIVAAVVSAAAFTYALTLYLNGTIELKYVNDVCKSCGAAVGFGAGFFIERRYIRFDTACDKLWQQFAKAGLGLAGVFIVKEGLKLIIGTSLAAGAIRYLLIVLWITVFFPLIMKKLFKSKVMQ